MNVKTFKFLFINDPITICSNNVHLRYPTIKIMSNLIILGSVKNLAQVTLKFSNINYIKMVPNSLRS